MILLDHSEYVCDCYLLLLVLSIKAILWIIHLFYGCLEQRLYNFCGLLLTSLFTTIINMLLCSCNSDTWLDGKWKQESRGSLATIQERSNYSLHCIYSHAVCMIFNSWWWVGELYRKRIVCSTGYWQRWWPRRSATYVSADANRHYYPLVHHQFVTNHC